MSQRAPRPSISMVVTGSATIFSPTTLLALDANTGKRIWHFQDVHHDLWDRDFPSAPSLLTVTHDGKRIDAVAQTTKTGYLYLFDRSTGEPLFPIEEHSYPASTVPGEVASPTQPRPLKPAPYARQLLTEDMLTNRTPEAHAWAVDKFRTFRSEGLFIPFGLDKQTINFPGFDGGAEWGGPRSILKPASSTSMRMRWHGQVGSQQINRRELRARRFIAVSAASVMELTEVAHLQVFHPWSVSARSLRTLRSQRRFIREKGGCRRFLT